ncbi:MAG: metal ABC transporter ATP-binding protein [Clostridia bacterium]|nr:metal ABC transporter ATP-binding protein [Clostridia bacterium]
MAQLSCRDLSLGYDSKIVVENLSFSVEKGDYLCIVGENGSGKSTLIKALLNLHAPLSGEILPGDGLTPSDIGYLPQQTNAQKDFPASVFEVVLSGCLSKRGWRPFYSAKEKAAAENAMAKLDILPLKKTPYRNLSGGQMQRVLLARALCATSKMLLLDEPVAGLDPLVTEELYALIDKLNREEGITIVMISHDIAAATTYAKHILHVGTPLFFGTKEDYMHTEHYKRMHPNCHTPVDECHCFDDKEGGHHHHV